MFVHYRTKNVSRWKYRLSYLNSCSQKPQLSPTTLRYLSSDTRNRLSSIWTPTEGSHGIISSLDDGLSLLTRAGFLRQAYSGIFHLLPLGLRVQEKLERLIEKYMNKLGASKLSLSSISSERLWQKSGRLEEYGSELFRLDKKRGLGFLLSPTHEEEITELVAKSTRSYKELPLRLYQISRKYRDERRPRGGLLRAREFLMKDLYTFDCTAEDALRTYHDVRLAYNGIFDELKIPYLVADADSGTMGGNLSHEYHFVSPLGEDTVINCNKCSYVANEEKARRRIPRLNPANTNILPFASWSVLAEGGNALVNVFYPINSLTHTPSDNAADAVAEVNPYAVKVAIPSLDASVEDPVEHWVRNYNSLTNRRIINIFDIGVGGTLPPHVRGQRGDLTPLHLHGAFASGTPVVDIIAGVDDQPLDLLRIRSGDRCPQCPNGTLESQHAVELGHTFYLGTRYSEPLGACVRNQQGRQTAVEMGCHGIGLSRIIGTVAATLADNNGLNWPRVVAPYDVVIIPAEGLADDAVTVYDALAATGNVDPIVDDRLVGMGWKLKDADLIGYPLTIVLGKSWRHSGKCEIQSKALDGFRAEVALEELPIYVQELLAKL